MAGTGAAPVVPSPRLPDPDHWTCAVCGLSFDNRPGMAQNVLCDECKRGPLGAAAGELARRLVGASRWQARENSLASITVRHVAVSAILEAAVKRPVADVERLHLALLHELAAPLVWQGPAYELALFQSALGRGPDPKPRVVRLPC